MSKKIGITIFLIVVFFAAGLGMGYDFGKSQNTAPLPEKPIKVGVLADLSGDYVSFLRGIVRGAEIALEDISQETGREIRLFIEDQKSCDSKETVTAMHKLVFVDEVDFIVGGSCSNTTIAAAPIANQNKVVMVSPSSSAPSISRAGEYIFRTHPSDSLRAKQVAGLLYGLNYRRLALVVDISNEATLEAAEEAKNKFVALGGEIAAEESISDNKQTDFRTQLTKIKSFKPDVLMISITSPQQVGLVIKQAREIGIGIQIVHPFEIPENKEVAEIAGHFIEGLIYTTQSAPPESQGYKGLKDKYEKKYPGDTVPAYCAEAYDALMLGVKAVLASDGTREDIKDKLYEVSKVYQGVSGNVAFDENGDVNKAILVKQIKNGQFVPYEE